MNMIDFHSHILPGIDDGAANIEVAKELLKSEVEQGVYMCVATPHFYENASIDEFLKMREASLASLMDACENEDIPELIVGAEVQLYCGLSSKEDLEKLCIGNTNYMLIEMPFCYWNDWYYEELDALIKRGIRPIIAHLDRYLGSGEDLKNIEKLFYKNVIIQVNAESMQFFSFKRIFKKLVKRGLTIVLGSDCHDLKKRPCLMEKAARVIERKYGEEYFANMMYVAEMILNNQSVG